MTAIKKNILVTRPAQQAAPLIAMLTQHGFNPVLCPTIAIEPLANEAAAVKELKKLAHFNQLIFTSVNAVQHANRLLNGRWPAHNAAIMAIGPKTQQALSDLNINSQCAQPPFNSEQLAQQLAGTEKMRNCLIVKGLDGRNFLEKSLQHAGFSVTIADVYRRCLPRTASLKLPQALDCISITSQLALDNLFLLYPSAAPYLKQNCQFITLSERIAKYAVSLGCKHTRFATQATDSALLEALLQP